MTTKLRSLLSQSASSSVAKTFGVLVVAAFVLAIPRAASAQFIVDNQCQVEDPQPQCDIVSGKCDACVQYDAGGWADWGSCTVGWFAQTGQGIGCDFSPWSWGDCVDWCSAGTWWEHFCPAAWRGCTVWEIQTVSQDPSVNQFYGCLPGTGVNVVTGENSGQPCQQTGCGGCDGCDKGCTPGQDEFGNQLTGWSDGYTGPDPDCDEKHDPAQETFVAAGTDCSTDKQGCATCQAQPDGTMLCVALPVDSQCPYSGSTTCDQWLCQADTSCKEQIAPVNTSCGDLDAGVCDQSKCDGQGNCQNDFADAGTPCTISDAGTCDKPACDGQGSCVDNWVDAGTPCVVQNGGPGECEPPPDNSGSDVLMCVPEGLPELPPEIACPHVGSARGVPNAVGGLINVEYGNVAQKIPIKTDTKGNEELIDGLGDVTLGLYLWHNDLNWGKRDACNLEEGGWTVNVNNEIRREKGDPDNLWVRDEKRIFMRCWQDSELKGVNNIVVSNGYPGHSKFYRCDEDDVLIEEFNTSTAQPPAADGRKYLYFYTPNQGKVVQYQPVGFNDSTLVPNPGTPPDLRLPPDVETCWHATQGFATSTLAGGKAPRGSSGEYLSSNGEAVQAFVIHRPYNVLPTDLTTGPSTSPREVYKFGYGGTNYVSLSTVSWGFANSTDVFTTTFVDGQSAFMDTVYYPPRNAADPSTSPVWTIAYDDARTNYGPGVANPKVVLKSVTSPAAEVDYVRETAPNSPNDRVTRETTIVGGNRLDHVTFREPPQSCMGMKTVVATFPHGKANLRNSEEYGFIPDKLSQPIKVGKNNGLFAYFRNRKNQETNYAWYNWCDAFPNQLVDGLAGQSQPTVADLRNKRRSASRDPFISYDPTNGFSYPYDCTDSHGAWQSDGIGEYYRYNKRGQLTQIAAINWNDPSTWTLSENTPGSMVVQKYDTALPYGFVTETWANGQWTVNTYSTGHQFLDPLPIQKLTKDKTLNDDGSVFVSNDYVYRQYHGYSTADVDIDPSDQSVLVEAGPQIRISATQGGTGAPTTWEECFRLNSQRYELKSGMTNGSDCFGVTAKRDFKQAITELIMPTNWGVGARSIYDPDPKTSAPRSVVHKNAVGRTEKSAAGQPDNYGDRVDDTITEPNLQGGGTKFLGEEKTTRNAAGDIATFAATLAGGGQNVIENLYMGYLPTGRKVNGYPETVMNWPEAPIPPLVKNKCDQ